MKIAGAFGSHIDCSLALVIGMFPDSNIDRIEPMGNAAGDVCRIALLNRSARKEADQLAKNMKRVKNIIRQHWIKE